jgi:DNA-binding XRE family transcriptional regulator
MSDATLIKDFMEYGKAHNLTKAGLAALINVSRETVHRWETCKVKMRAGNRRAIIRVLKFSADVVFNEFDHLTSEMFNEWKCLDRKRRLKILQYVEEIK